MPKRKDENELAKLVIDDIIAETESEDWNKENRRADKKDASSKPKARKLKSIISTNPSRQK